MLCVGQSRRVCLGTCESNTAGCSSNSGEAIQSTVAIFARTRVCEGAARFSRRGVIFSVAPLRTRLGLMEGSLGACVMRRELVETRGHNQEIASQSPGLESYPSCRVTDVIELMKRRQGKRDEIISALGRFFGSCWSTLARRMYLRLLFDWCGGFGMALVWPQYVLLLRPSLFCGSAFPLLCLAYSRVCLCLGCWLTRAVMKEMLRFVLCAFFRVYAYPASVRLLPSSGAAVQSRMRKGVECVLLVNVAGDGEVAVEFFFRLMFKPRALLGRSICRYRCSPRGFFIQTAVRMLLSIGLQLQPICVVSR